VFDKATTDERWDVFWDSFVLLKLVANFDKMNANAKFQFVQRMYSTEHLMRKLKYTRK